MRDEVMHTVVPSQPGWSIAQFRGNPVGVNYDPIVAWAIATTFRDNAPFRACPGPITAGAGVARTTTVSGECGVAVGIRKPDGQIEFAEDGKFDNEADALKAVARALRDESKVLEDA